MKIVFFAFTIMEYGGGLENYFITTSHELLKKNPQTEISIVTLSAEHAEKLQGLLSIYYLKKRNINLLYKISPEDIKSRLGKVKYIKATSISALKKELQKYNVIYSKNEILDLLVLKRIGYENLPPIIVGVHTALHYPNAKLFHSKLHNFLYSSFLYRFLLNGVKLVHIINDDAEKFVISNFGIPVKKIYNPFDIDLFSNNKLLKNDVDVYFDKDKFNIVFIARLTEQKGIYDLEKIIKKIDGDRIFRNKLMFHICGDGNLKYIINDLCKSTQCTKYYGFIKDTRLPLMLKNADLFISTAKWESLPYNIMEAQAMEVPVIAFDIPGPNDIIINNKTGLLVKNIDDFIQAIYACSEGKYKFENFLENIVEKFNPDEKYKDLFEMFKNVCIQ